MRILFFTHNAYDMLTGGHEGDTAGGAQLQQILVGKELANRGHDICFVEYDSQYKTESMVDGIQVSTILRPTGSESRRAVQVVQGIRQVVRTFDPDICYRRVLDFVAIPLSFLSSLLDFRFVYGIAHDDELSKNPHSLSGGIKSSRPYLELNRRALSNADAVVAQNRHQHNLAQERLNTHVETIPNCYPDAPADPIELDHSRPIIFWAARFEEWKQPDLVADLAESIPDATFLMAGSPGDESLYQQIQARAQSIKNLTLTGHIPISEIDRYFGSVDVFLNTSKGEGFPNTFLQSWVHSTPVVSFDVDPNDILKSNDMGLVAGGSRETLREHLTNIIENNTLRQQLGRASRRYYESNHTVSEIATQYERVFEGK